MATATNATTARALDATGAHDLATHPKGLYVLFATEMWERFSFYSMLALFTLYLQDPVDGFGWSAERATNLYSWYLMFVYASPLVGGFIADRKLGYRKSVMLGGFFFMVGHLLLAFPTVGAVYAALTCLVVGNGFFKPNVSTMVGNLYPEGSHLKDRAYNIFYMGINIGAFVAPIVAEFVKQTFGVHPAFAVAAGGMVISVAILWYFKREVIAADERATALRRGKQAADAAAVTVDAPPSEASQQQGKSLIDQVPDWKRIMALVVIFAIVIVFWMVFHQNGSTLTYWADDNTAWDVSGTISNAINPFWIITLTFPLVWFWKWLDNKGKEPSTPSKMAFGMFLTALSFFILYAAARTGEGQTYTPGQLASGSFRVTERTLENLQAQGVPADVIERLKAKGGDGQSLLLNKKLSADTTFKAKYETALASLRMQGVPEDVVKRLDKYKDEKFDATQDFSASLGQVLQKAQAEGVPADALAKLQAQGARTFTGREKLTERLKAAVGPEAAPRYEAAVMQESYLFRVSPLWLILAYAVISLGELMLSPMGLSLVSKVAPIRMRGLLMGGWFVATAIGNKLTAIGVYWTYWKQSSFFIILGGMALVMSVVLLMLLRPLKKAMPGV